MRWGNAWIICRDFTTGKLIRGILRYILKKKFFFRYSNQFHEIHPIFPGWLTILTAKASSSANKTILRTFEIYLPPVPSKVANPNTIYECMLYLQNRAAKVNMKYTNITLNVGAAINAFKVLWTYPEILSNVAFHLS